MSARDWEERVLATEGAAERVGEIEQELLLASKLTARRPRPAASKPPGCVFRTPVLRSRPTSSTRALRPLLP